MGKSRDTLPTYLSRWRKRTLNSGQSPDQKRLRSIRGCTCLLIRKRKKGRDDYTKIYDETGEKLKLFLTAQRSRNPGMWRRGCDVRRARRYVRHFRGMKSCRRHEKWSWQQYVNSAEWMLHDISQMEITCYVIKCPLSPCEKHYTQTILITLWM